MVKLVLDILTLLSYNDGSVGFFIWRKLMPKYIVETISMFRIRYIIEAECAEHAADEVTMEEAKEFSQLHLGEHISSVRPISDEEICDLFFEDHDYITDWPREKALEFVNKIEYEEGSLYESV